jgi:hypothetical protein
MSRIVMILSGGSVGVGMQIDTAVEPGAVRVEFHGAAPLDTGWSDILGPAPVSKFEPDC